MVQVACMALAEILEFFFFGTSAFGGFLWFFSGEASFADDEKALRFFRRERPASSSRSVSKALVSSAGRSLERAALYVSKNRHLSDWHAIILKTQNLTIFTFLSWYCAMCKSVNCYTLSWAWRKTASHRLKLLYRIGSVWTVWSDLVLVKALTHCLSKQVMQLDSGLLNFCNWSVTQYMWTNWILLFFLNFLKYF